MKQQFGGFGMNGSPFGMGGFPRWGRFLKDGQQAPQAPPPQETSQQVSSFPQPVFQNDFVYKKPTFGMQRQMTTPPSNQWRLGY